MYYVYILQSVNDASRHYIGLTNDMDRRLSEHNSESCSHTKKYAPWKIKNYFAFDREAVAQRFEKYLKTGSGRQFSRRHFQ